MKKNLISLSVLSVLALAACDGYKKNPVSDLSSIREAGQAEMNKGPQKPKEITNTVVVEKEVVQYREGTTVDGSSIVISTDAQMTFSEGQTSTYKIHARALKPGVKVSLSVESKPDYITLSESKEENGLFILTGKPGIHTISANEAIKFVPLKLTAKVVSAVDPVDMEKFKNLVTSANVTLIVVPNQELPSNIQISGLDSIVPEGQITTFTVTAKVPGTDAQSAKKPTLNIFYDKVMISAGNDFRELDGARYVSADMNNKEPEYLQDSVWKFTLTFDTKNISVQPQLNKEGAAMPKADGTRVRMSLFVTDPNGLRTPEILKQIKIVYTKSASAPKFDVLGLAQQSLEVSRGQKIKLDFTVSSTDAGAKILVESESNLPGSPQVSCKPSGAKNTRSCTLNWTVPCDVSADKLTGTVDMKADSVVGDRVSESTSYSLATTVAAKEVDLCSPAKTTPQTPAKAETKTDSKPAQPTAKPTTKKAS